MASLPDDTGKCESNSRSVFPGNEPEEIFARALGNAMRRLRMSNEMLEQQSPYKERRIETFRSLTESGPVSFGDFLEMAAALGVPFVTAVLTNVNMYAAEYRGASPEKIASEAIELLEKITGGAK